MRVKVWKEPGGDGPGARRGGGGGINVINVRSCYTGSSNELEDAQEQAPTQVPNSDKFFDP